MMPLEGQIARNAALRADPFRSGSLEKRMQLVTERGIDCV